jgi:integrase
MGNDRTTLSQAVDEFLAARKARQFSPATLKQDEALLRAFTKHVGNIQVRHLTQGHVERWLYGHLMVEHVSNHQVLPPLSAAAHNAYRSKLIQFHRYARRHGIRPDLLDNCHPLRVGRRVRQRPTVDVLLAMLESTETPRDRVLIALGLNTALRASEIVRLRIKDVDLAGGWLRTDIRKSRMEDLLPITLDLDQELRRWLRHYTEQVGTLDPEFYLVPGISKALFEWNDGVRTNGAPVLRPDRPLSAPERIVQRSLAAVGLEVYGEGVHSLRRALARVMYDSLVEQGHEHAIRTVSAWLHHSDSRVTERYIGLTTEATRRDLMLRGQPWLSSVTRTDNVVRLHSVKDA